MTNLLLIISLLSLASCGGSSGGSSGGNINTENSTRVETANGRENQENEGRYHAVIRPLNTSVYGFITSGGTDIEVSEGNIKIDVYMDDTSSAKHMQSIHAGIKCPTQEEDPNGDGFMDAVEIQSSAGAQLIPLDADISSLEKGADIYPTTSEWSYKESAYLEDLLNDLRSKNKLLSDEELNLDGRVVIVYGAPASKTLPATVAALPGKTQQESTPIGCGVIRRSSAQ